MRIGIVGGGIMGLTVGYMLAERGHSADVFEGSPVLGGLAGPITLQDGTDVDRFYHAILSSDEHLLEVCEKLGISDQLRFKETKTGVFIGGGIHQMSDAIQFLTFPPLRPIDRLRLGLTIVAARRVKDWRTLEQVGLEDWLVKYGGRRLFDRFWNPMLTAKFDGTFKRTPATYMWSRFVRMTSMRKGVRQKEMSGHLIGGYPTLLRAMTRAIERAGGSVRLNAAVSDVLVDSGRASGLRVNGQSLSFDGVVLTMQTPIAARLVPSLPEAYRQSLTAWKYLGIVCPLLVMKRPLSDFWVTNVADTAVPFTGVIETTAYIDPKYVGGHHLVYIPKYTAPDSPWQRASDDEIRRVWFEGLRRIVPAFDERDVAECRIHRERFVEPLHSLDGQRILPSIETPVDGLFLTTTAQIYPALTNGESVTQHARAAAEVVLDANIPALERECDRPSLDVTTPVP